VSDQEFKRALGYASSAIDLLTRATIPPYPHFYELLYTYVSGVNPTLNARINAIFRETDPTVDLAERLYDTFLKAQDNNERLASASEQLGQGIEVVHDALDAAMTTANAFAGAVQAMTGDLAGEPDHGALQLMARRMLEEARRMQVANHDLEQKLQASRETIAQLHRDLDDARRESMLDPLTKIYNRKFLDELLIKAVNDARSSGTQLSLVLLDIDHFKHFNATWGHQTGDHVLRLVAMTLKSSISSRQVAARYNGKEFAVVLRDTDLEGAMAVAESVRRTIEAKDLLKRSTGEKLGQITCSFGVATLRRGDTPTSLVERTARCLFAAKQAGRNKVVNENDLKPDIEAAG